MSGKQSTIQGTLSMIHGKTPDHLKQILQALIEKTQEIEDKTAKDKVAR